MNLDYISGFFDADGSVGLYRFVRGGYRIPCVTFHNTDLSLIKEIRTFFLENHGFRGSLSTKKPTKKTHSISYDLTYSYNQAYILCGLITSRHKFKIKRTRCITKYYNLVTNRNGRYTQTEIQRKLAFERLFIML